MHSSDNNSLFAAWSEAERQAREAERRLYEIILSSEGRPPCREDAERARALRERASELMNGMLEGLRGEALQLRTTRDSTSSGWTAPQGGTQPTNGAHGSRYHPEA